MINQIKKIKLFNIMTIDQIIITINRNKSYKKKKIISKNIFNNTNNYKKIWKKIKFNFKLFLNSKMIINFKLKNKDKNTMNNLY